jgi:Glycosyl hydrolase family 12
MKHSFRRATSRAARPRAAILPTAVLGAAVLAAPLLSATSSSGAGGGAARLASADASRSRATAAPPAQVTLGPSTLAPMPEGPAPATATTPGAKTPATGGPPASGGGLPSQLCEPDEYLNVDGPWGGYVLKNNDFHPTTAPECISHSKRGPNFGVSKSSATARGSESDAYPNIFVGCSWGKCSDHSALPARLSAVGHPWVSWYAKLVPRGKWDANLDIWLSSRPRRTGQVTGAEVMIWLSARGFGSVGDDVNIDGIGWSLEHWTTRSLTQPKDRWPLIIFRATRSRSHVRRLALQPFFRELEHLHLIRGGDWIDSVHGGFEIWNGGKGMTMNWFRAGGGL